LAVDSGCTPERIGAAHPPNEIPHFRPNRGPTPSVSTLPCPVAPEALTVPPHHCLGPHHLQRTPPVLPQPRQHDPEEPVRRPQLWARLAHLPHGDLLSQCEVLQHQLPLRANRGPRCPNEDRKPSRHIRSIADQSRQPQDNRAGRVFRKDTLRRETSALVVGQPDAQPVRRRIRIAPELQRVKRSNGNPWRLVLAAVALRQLLEPQQLASLPIYIGGLLAVTLVGWATGGIVAGVLADYIGRKRVLMLSILWYALFTGLTALATSYASFMILRFLT